MLGNPFSSAGKAEAVPATIVKGGAAVTAPGVGGGAGGSGAGGIGAGGGGAGGGGADGGAASGGVSSGGGAGGGGAGVGGAGGGGAGGGQQGQPSTRTSLSHLPAGEKVSLVSWSKFNLLESVVEDLRNRVYGSMPKNEDILEEVRFVIRYLILITAPCYSDMQIVY